MDCDDTVELTVSVSQTPATRVQVVVVVPVLTKTAVPDVMVKVTPELNPETSLPNVSVAATRRGRLLSTEKEVAAADKAIVPIDALLSDKTPWDSRASVGEADLRVIE